MAYTVYRVQLYMRHGAHQTAISGYSGFPHYCFSHVQWIYSTLQQFPHHGQSLPRIWTGTVYTPIIHPVRILGYIIYDYSGMGTVASLSKSAVHGCMHAAWWYICTWGYVAGMGI